jgi:hypothetical protein
MKKKLNIVLLVLVFGLWGTVIYKYISQYLVSNELVTNGQQEISSNEITIKDKDTFDLKPLKRDPFLNKRYDFSNRKKVFEANKRSIIHSPAINIQQKNFPEIKYFGYIKPLHGNGELFLIKVNGKLLKLKSNEVKEGVKVVKIFKDSIKVSFNDETKIIKK